MEMKIMPVSAPQNLRGDVSTQTPQPDAADAPSSYAPDTEEAQPSAAAAAAYTDSMDFDSLEVTEMEAHSTARGEHARHARPKMTNMQQMREMPRRRLNRVFQAMEGHTGTENESEKTLHDSAQAMLSKAIDGNEIDDMIAALDANPTRRFVILSTLEIMMKAQLENGSSRLTAGAQESVRANLAKVGAALDKILRGNGKRIRSGLNTADALHHFSDLIDERDRLRDIYYDVVVTGSSVRETFERLLKAFGAAKFLHTVQTMRHAIVDDMKAPFPTANRILLETYYQGLKETHTITALIHNTGDLKKRVGPSALETDAGVVDFLSQVLRYTEGPGNPRQFRQICNAVTGKSEEDGNDEDKDKDKNKNKNVRVDESIARHVKAFLLKYVPLDLWVDNETRDTLLTPRRSAPKAAA